jgi:hypothetical protein
MTVTVPMAKAAIVVLRRHVRGQMLGERCRELRTARGRLRGGLVDA